MPVDLRSHCFDPKTRVLRVAFASRGGEGALLLHIPEHRYPDGFIVTINEVETKVEIDADTRRGILPWDGEAGEYRVEICPRAGQSTP
jgi:hypothetical protein